MLITDEDRVVVPLDEAECHALLSDGHIGRLGYTRDALPAIQPVTYRCHDGEVVIPSLPCSDYLSATRGAIVAFQVDAYDDSERTGWSINVIGPARRVEDPAQVLVCDRLDWPHPTTVPGLSYVAVRIGLVRGWRTVPSPVSRRRRAGA